LPTKGTQKKDKHKTKLLQGYHKTTEEKKTEEKTNHDNTAQRNTT
jgi:hypothetical protein